MGLGTWPKSPKGRRKIRATFLALRGSCASIARSTPATHAGGGMGGECRAADPELLSGALVFWANPYNAATRSWPPFFPKPRQVRKTHSLSLPKFPKPLLRALPGVSADCKNTPFHFRNSQSPNFPKARWLRETQKHVIRFQNSQKVSLILAQNPAIRSADK